jgi:TM2 domain-containing membrane protein YozV/ribosomal protein L40E
MSEVSVQKAPDEKFCGECGAIIKLKAEICPKCGVRQMPTPLSAHLGSVASNGKSRVSTALLAFFLGGFGAHKFYLGQVGRGILYLLFFWTFIPAIIAFVEFILFLVMTDDEFNRKYGAV